MLKTLLDRCCPRGAARLVLALLVASPVWAQELGSAAGVELPTEGQALRHAAIAARYAERAAAPRIDIAGGGLVAVLGGAAVRLTGRRPAVVQLPLPQDFGGQVPLAFATVADPPEAVQSFHVHAEGSSGAVVTATLQGRSGLDVRLQWAAVVLVAERKAAAEAAAAAPWLAASACAQAEHEDVRALADRLAPAAAPPAALARAVQQFVRELQPRHPPKSLDALGLLASGQNGICTANANLAAAVLRSRGVPARSLAVVPPIGVRLEMHRTVEWHEDGAWHRFDPSSLHEAVPMRATDGIVMAVTSIADEERGGRLRMSASLGCPYAQQIEIVGGPAILFGAEMFWTQALPLLAVAAEDQELAAARACWRGFLGSGRLDPRAWAAAQAGDRARFRAALLGD
jgi:transglutaminase-like putative cysteine protease